MYIELFLLDNLLMNLLIMRLAAALLHVSPPLYRQMAAVISAAAYAALAAYFKPVLAVLPLRVLPLIMMTAAMPAKSVRGFLTSALSILLATLAVGGLAFFIALAGEGSLDGGFIHAGVGLRKALIIAAAASCLPRIARSILRRRIKNGLTVELAVVHRGLERRFAALVDTGNGVVEPLTGLPVAVVRCPAFKSFAALPIEVATASGRCVFYAFRPDKMSVDGVPVAGLVALAEGAFAAEALVPPELAAVTGVKKEELQCSKDLLS